MKYSQISQIGKNYFVEEEDTLAKGGETDKKTSKQRKTERDCVVRRFGVGWVLGLFPRSEEYFL